MGVDLRLPNITASTPEGRVQQMQSYMYQLVQQLNWALSAVESASNGGESSVVVDSSVKSLSPEAAQNTFNSIKALIIKSAEIVKAYEEKITDDYNALYFADSDFGQFVSQTKLSIEKSASGISEAYAKIEEISNAGKTGSLDRLITEIRETDGYIKRGDLGTDAEGNTIIGIEVGQTDTVNGVETFNKYARFTAGGIFFYLPGATDAVAYMTGTTLYITNAVITGSLKLGGYIVDLSNGVAFKWAGGDS